MAGFNATTAGGAKINNYQKGVYATLTSTPGDDLRGYPKKGDLLLCDCRNTLSKYTYLYKGIIGQESTVDMTIKGAVTSHITARTVGTDYYIALPASTVANSGIGCIYPSGLNNWENYGTVEYNLIGATGSLYNLQLDDTGRYALATTSTAAQRIIQFKAASEGYELTSTPATQLPANSAATYRNEFVRNSDGVGYWMIHGSAVTAGNRCRAYKQTRDEIESVDITEILDTEPSGWAQRWFLLEDGYLYACLSASPWLQRYYFDASANKYALETNYVPPSTTVAIYQLALSPNKKRLLYTYLSTNMYFMAAVNDVAPSAAKATTQLGIMTGAAYYICPQMLLNGTAYFTGGGIVQPYFGSTTLTAATRDVRSVRLVSSGITPVASAKYNDDTVLVVVGTTTSLYTANRAIIADVMTDNAYGSDAAAYFRAVGIAESSAQPNYDGITVSLLMPSL